MSRPPLEVADILKQEGAAWRRRHAGHLSLGQLRVMSALEQCRTQVLGGHVLHCSHCKERQIAYNSCRNRHCPKCGGAKAQQWLEARQSELLPVPYYHVVFTLPAEIADLAYQNKTLLYDLLFKIAAQTLLTIAADPKHLGARIGFTSVLHTWGSALTHHPHVHCIVPGGGLNADGQWQPCKTGFLLPVRVLSRLFRRLFLAQLRRVHQEGQLRFFGKLDSLRDTGRFIAYLKPLRQTDWVVYAKPPFAGPQAALRYLAGYTHRIAISNQRLLRFDKQRVTFQWKDYRAKGQITYQPMTLSSDEFIRRFLIHVLPKGFHRIRHYGLLASPVRQRNLQALRAALDVYVPAPKTEKPEKQPVFVCRSCGTPLQIIDVIAPRTRAPP